MVPAGDPAASGRIADTRETLPLRRGGGGDESDVGTLGRARRARRPAEIPVLDTVTTNWPSNRASRDSSAR